MGWEVGGRFMREQMHDYLWLIHVDIWQKATQHCKATILQLRINKLKNKQKLPNLAHTRVTGGAFKKYKHMGSF